MFLQFTEKLLLSIIIIGIIIWGVHPIAAAEDGGSWEIVIGYEDYHIRDDLPEGYRNQLEEGNSLFNFGIEYITGISNGQFSFSLDAKGDGDHLESNLKEFNWSGYHHQVLYELGKTKWVWGRGLSFIPTCPLDTETYYWGGQVSVISLDKSGTIGFATAKDSYNSDASATLIMDDQASDSDYTGWLRWGQTFETSDLSGVVSYQSAEKCWNYGLDFSRDLQNGFELHGGIKQSSSDSEVSYLIGSEYIGKYFYTVEFYHDQDDLLILAINNAVGLFGKWQWMLREIYNFNDDGVISKLNLGYHKNDHLVPQLEISMNTGPKSSIYRQNPIDYYLIFKVVAKF
ncbi:MAG: hypothetical protein GXY86_09895 [Firmicutes bacterium]|nr:hypothetical protein [Bacillota bacterium]